MSGQRIATDGKEMYENQATEVQRAILRSMKISDRLRLACEMSDLAHDLCRARIRQQHPDWSEAEVTREMVRAALADLTP